MRIAAALDDACVPLQLNVTQGSSGQSKPSSRGERSSRTMQPPNCSLAVAKVRTTLASNDAVVACGIANGTAPAAQPRTP